MSSRPALPTLSRFARLGVDFVITGTGAAASRRWCELTPDVQQQINESALEIATELQAAHLAAVMLEIARGER